MEQEGSDARVDERALRHQSGEDFDFPGMHVADGSSMPRPVGPNPSLTIAALADRFPVGLYGAYLP